MYNNMKITKILTPKELLEKYIDLNPKNKIIKWEILQNDECTKYADPKQPIIKIYFADDNWIRIFVSMEYGEINWY